MKTSRLVIVVCSLFFAFTAAVGQAQSSDTTATANAVYVTNCAKCHGKNAEGRRLRGPSLTSAKVAAASEDELRNIITDGKSHMPKYKGKLTSDEIDTLVQQIKALNKK